MARNLRILILVTNDFQPVQYHSLCRKLIHGSTKRFSSVYTQNKRRVRKKVRLSYALGVRQIKFQDSSSECIIADLYPVCCVPVDLHLKPSISVYLFFE